MPGLEAKKAKGSSRRTGGWGFLLKRWGKLNAKHDALVDIIRDLGGENDDDLDQNPDHSMVECLILARMKPNPRRPSRTKTKFS